MVTGKWRLFGNESQVKIFVVLFADCTARLVVCGVLISDQDSCSSDGF